MMAIRFILADKYTKKYKDRLHKCNYCGNTDVRVGSSRSIFPPKNQWFVACMTYACDCTGDFDRVIDAVMDWEERH